MANTNEPGPWVKYVTGKDGMFGRLNQNKTVGETLKQSFKWEGQKGTVFARGAGVTVGLAAAGDALFRSHDSDGNERGGLTRVGEFLLGTGVAVGSALVGKGRA